MCARAKQLYAGEHGCQSIGGGRLEKTVLAEVFAVLEPAALAATAQALAEADAHYRQRLAVFELAVERARFEADRARRQFDAVEPENRLVARTLEKSLEDKLAAVAPRGERPGRPAGPPPGRADSATPNSPGSPRAGADIRAVFDAPSTTTVANASSSSARSSPRSSSPWTPARASPTLRIIWQGGATTELTMPMTKRGGHTAHHRRGHRRPGPPAGRRTTTTAPSPRSWPSRDAAPRTGLTVHHEPAWRPCAPPRHPRLPAAAQPDVGPDDHDAVVVTITEAEKILGVCKVTLYRWLRDGFITGEQTHPRRALADPHRPELRDRIRPEVPDGWLALDEAAAALGVARQTVLHKVQRGELHAVHVNRGRRKGLRIQVKPDQAGLFDTTDGRNAQC